jgi:hypothetical protein
MTLESEAVLVMLCLGGIFGDAAVDDAELQR